jgi:H/ACA ribonucleoprotein complex subunit 3
MRMRKCVSCGIYTFKDFCPKCNQKTVNPEQPKFSPEDKYGKYRRMISKNL